MKKNKHIFIMLLSLLALAACNTGEVAFTYSPTSPRAGQAISFRNQTQEGEKWEWNFGDGTSSTSKSPSKTYKRPGVYTVVLKVDEKVSRSCSQTITVLDTVPCINVSDTLVYVFTPVRLTAGVYNPYNATLTYDWQLGDEVRLLSGKTTDKTIEVCFTKHSAKTAVGCKVMFGEREMLLDTALEVLDTVAPSLLMSTNDGRLLRQRLFATGEEAIVDCGVEASWLTAAKSLAVEGDTAFLFNADKTKDAALVAYELRTKKAFALLANSETADGQGFYNGIVDNGAVYWTDEKGGFVYMQRLPDLGQRSFAAGVNSEQYLTDVTQLGAYSLATGSEVTGFAIYNNVYYLGYGAGVYRFEGAAGAWNCTAGSMLADVKMQKFAIDAVARKVYFIAEGALWVSGLTGQNATQLASGVVGTALCVDNRNNRLYWAQEEGVYYLPLVQTANNVTTATPKLLNNQTNVAAIAVDAKPRLAK